jgi:SAM-dependent methyltransferase
VVPPVRTRRCDSERLLDMFEPDSFDVAYASNTLDHSYDPLRAIRQMIAVVRPGGIVLLQHFPNPKLRPVGWGFPALTRSFWVPARRCSDYFKASGIGAPIRSKASRWALVGSASRGTVVAAPANRTSLRVRVARWSRRPRKL